MSILGYVLDPASERTDRFMAIPTDEGHEVWDSDAGDTVPIVFDTPEAAAACAQTYNVLDALGVLA